MKRLRRDKKGSGPLVCSQKQISLLVMVINRLLIGYQPVVNRLLCSSIVSGTCFVLKRFIDNSGDGPLVSIQEQRALLVIVTNRLSTGFSIGLHIMSVVRSSREKFRRRVLYFRCFGGYDERLSPGRTGLSVSRSAQPHPAAPPCAHPDSPVVYVSGFWIRQVNII